MSNTKKNDTFGTKTTLTSGGQTYGYYSMKALENAGMLKVAKLPFSIRILLESLLRNENGESIRKQDIETLCKYDPKNASKTGEIPFLPARVVLQDFTGVPAVVDLAAMRSAVARMGGDPKKINPQIPVDLVIDHSVQVDRFGDADALAQNAKIEFDRNRERYSFLRWGQTAFENFGVVPPATGIVHQVNLEYLASVVQSREVENDVLAYPDTLVGTDSHTTMINGLGVLGWGVGGIEAEAVMLGQPIYMLCPEVVGFKLSGKLPEGATATDLTLTVTQILRKHGVVGKFVEFFGRGLDGLTLADRATIANMAPEYGATMGFFPVDEETLRYMRSTGRPEKTIELVKAFCEAQDLFRDDNTPDPEFATTLELDLGQIEPSLAGPKRPQDRIALSNMKKEWHASLSAAPKDRGFGLSADQKDDSVTATFEDGATSELKHGSVVIAAITSCTNTSNPSVMLAAGLVAKKAAAKGLTVAPYVKTSLAPGSRVVSDYLDKAGLTDDLEKLGFFTVGYGCTTCIGNSGPLPEPVAKAIESGDLIAASVLSGNRNFEGRVHALVKANYLASPPLVVAYAIAGTVDIDLATDAIGKDASGNDVFLKDIWPTSKEVGELLSKAEDPAAFRARYDGVEDSNPEWSRIPITGGEIYDWDEASTYIQEPPFFVGMDTTPPPIAPIADARVLVKVGDSVTTDHISPAGAIPKDSAAAKYLLERNVDVKDWNSFGSRRGNDRIMTRGTFGNIRLKNQMAPGTEGGFTTHVPSGNVTSIYEAAQQYQSDKVPTVVLAGVDYGMGSSRDWAAKGTFLLGVKAVIAKSFERIHRSNLVGMGVLPLQFAAGEDCESLNLTGKEYFSIAIDDNVKAGQDIVVSVADESGAKREFTTTCRIDTPIEVDYYRNGGILHTVLRRLATA